MNRSRSLDLTDFRDVPIVQIDLDNYVVVWPCLISAITSATFVALDTELSGLGDRKLLKSKDLEDRYQAIVKTARTHSILSLGLSCYRMKTENELAESHSDGSKDDFQFEIQTFNILVLCQDAYIVEPESLKFLSDHGFDFNRQCSHGLPYVRGQNKDEIAEFSLRRVFAELVNARPPIVLHNAMVDLIFLYESLYTALPSTLSTFVTDLSVVFPSGIYDTKYISEFVSRSSRSYLEYLFRRSQRDNSACRLRSQPYTYVTFPSYDALLQPYIVTSPCGLSDQPCQRDVGKTTVCAQFDAHGWCLNGLECTMSHDLDLILDAEDWLISGGSKKTSKKQSLLVDNESNSKNKISVVLTSNPDTPTNAIVENDLIKTLSKSSTNVNRVSGHSAGFDAFMTGYAFATYVTRNPRLLLPVPQSTGHGRSFADNPANNIYLCYKDFPMKIERSSYSKPSKGHRETYRNIQQSQKCWTVTASKTAS